MIYEIDHNGMYNLFHNSQKRAPYGYKYMKADREGWIMWEGTSNTAPIDGQPFEFKTRGGNVYQATSVNHWGHRGDSGDILAYRPIFHDKKADTVAPEIGKRYTIIDDGCNLGEHKVVGFDDGKVIVSPSENKYMSIDVNSHTVFEPVIEKKSFIINEMAKVMYDCDLAGNISAVEAAKALYSAIEKGAIEGVELSGSVDHLNYLLKTVYSMKINDDGVSGLGYNKALDDVAALIMKVKKEMNVPE